MNFYARKPESKLPEITYCSKYLKLRKPVWRDRVTDAKHYEIP
jgi:hypothetical protein